MDTPHRARSLEVGPAALAAVVLAALALGAAAARPHGARALERDLRAARAKYPGIAGTRLDDCALCHTGGHYALDPYGRAFEAARRDFAAIEADDSDGDGFANLAEIQALTFPGKADDFPSVTPTAGTPAPSAVPTETATTAPTHEPTGAPTRTATAAPTHAPSPEASATAAPGHAWLPVVRRRYAR